MAKRIATLLVRALYYFGYGLYYFGYGLFWLLTRFLLLIWRVLVWSAKRLWGRRSPNPSTPPELPAQEFPEPVIPAVEKTGSIFSPQEDHDLRIFTILNPEGEIYRINTAVPGDFYGPVWTYILNCYQCRQTLKARLVKMVYGRSGHPSGYQVKIGTLKAFLPNYHSMRKASQTPINIRVAILSIDPLTRKITVSSRLAYDLLLGEQAAPQIGAEVQSLYWDYDNEYVYLLLPGGYLGQAPHDQDSIVLDQYMGELVTCRVLSLDPDEREAQVALSCSDSPQPPVQASSCVPPLLPAAVGSFREEEVS